jgi:mitochondrial chaperone BCS1
MGFAGFSTSITRPKRSLDSVVLDEEVKQMLLDDTQEFLGSENWYAERGIPWRRGYLLHGCPGSGKTSLSKSSLNANSKTH